MEVGKYFKRQMNRWSATVLVRIERQRGKGEGIRERTGGFSDPGVFIAGKGESHTHTRTGGYPSHAVK